MDKNTAIKAVRFLVAALEDQGLHVKEAVLFGSLARDEWDVDSDIDIAVVSSDFENKDLFERAKLTGRAEVEAIRRFSVPIDVILLTPDEYMHGNSLVAQFVREGESVYEA